MKLCIIKPDGTNAEILFSDNQPSLENINNDILLFENYLYKLIIRSEETFDNIELFIGDYQIPLNLNPSTGCYETENIIGFMDCFDLVFVSVNVNNVGGEERAFYSEYLRVATTKQTISQVEKMLGEIEDNLPNFLDVCFSHGRKRAGLLQNDTRSIWNTLRIIDEIISIYEENYSYFCNQKKCVIKQEAVVVDVKSMRKVDQESLIWIASNPDNLVETENESVINYNGKHYTPTKIKTYVSKYSFDIYENRVILGFLHSIIEYINNQIAGFNREILELENIPNSIIVQLPNTHGLTGRCVYIYYRGVIEKYENKREILQELYCRYMRSLECDFENVVNVPKLTNTFKRVYHYRVCYEYMVKWFEAGDYSFEHLNYLFKLKTLSRIFEYYCLIRLQAAIAKNGYVLKNVSRIIYDVEIDSEEINNKYVFSGPEYELTLLYEPSIWVNKINDGINLYSTGYNFAKCSWNDRWAPDFVIKILTSTREYYYILDAKYSNWQNVKKRYIPELVLKYGTQIASYNKFFSDVIGVGAVYPGDNDKMYFFKKNEISSSKQSLPNYFAIEIVGGEDGRNALERRIRSLLETIDALETEDNELIGTNKKDIIIEKNSIKIQSKDILKSDLQELSDNTNKIEKHSVYGKKCFYFSKGMCLRQKTRCMIEGFICELYEHKNCRKLLCEENTCRNLIHYYRKGKVNQVECTVSGFYGCVGSDKCKFYLKKKK